TEFYAAYRPYVVGQEGRFTAHLSHITDRFEAYPVTSKVTMTIAVGGTTIEKTSVPDRSGHFPFAFTPTVAGTGRRPWCSRRRTVANASSLTTSSFHRICRLRSRSRVLHQP